MTEDGEQLRADGSAFCLAHRLRYDPQLNVGCVLCQRVFASSRAPAEAPPALLLPALLGVLCGILVAIAIELTGTPQDDVTRPALAHAAANEGLGMPTAGPSDRHDPPAPQPATTEEESPSLPPDAPVAGLSG